MKRPPAAFHVKLRRMSDPVPARLAELAAHWKLPAAAPAALARLLELVAAEPASITTVRDPARGVETHVADSLSGLHFSGLRDARRIADLGSGGGFPGLVLAIALPAATVALVESVGRKCAFLRAAAAELGLANVEVIEDRAETWEAGRGWADMVTARALAPLPVLVEYAAPLLRRHGTLIAWKGHPDPAEEANGVAAAPVVGMEASGLTLVHDVRGADERRLYFYLKVGATPASFPRRPGMARKRPLGLSDRA